MIDSEQLQVTGGQGTTTWTCSRGTNGTSAATHLVTANVFQSATTLIPIEPVFFEPVITRYNPALMRNSFEKFYETQIVSEKAALKGVKAPATYETLTNFLSWFIKGGVVATTSDSHAYSWAFTPTLTADDLPGIGAEMGNDTATYHMPAMYGDQMVLEFDRAGTSVMVTTDYVAQQAVVMGAKTPGLTRTGLNMLNPATTATYLDSSSIGTTLVNDISSAKITLMNAFQQLFFLNNVLYPTGAVRPTRNLQIDYVAWFDSPIELANAMNAANAGTERKSRLLVTGPLVPSSLLTNSLTIDSYFYWDTFPFQMDVSTWRVNFSGRSVYDVSAGTSWSATLVNSLSAIP